MARESAGPRTQGRARGERARAHAEARPERRRYIAHGIAAAGAQAFDAEGPGGINALHGEAGHILHMVFPSAACAFCDACRTARPESPNGRTNWRGLWRSGPVVSRGKTTRYWGRVPRPSMAHSMPRMRGNRNRHGA